LHQPLLQLQVLLYVWHSLQRSIIPALSLPLLRVVCSILRYRSPKRQPLTCVLPTPTTEAAIDANAPPPEEFVDPAGPVDSDEEKELVLAGIARWRPQPVEQYIPVPIRRRYEYIRMRNLLGQALSGASPNAGRGTGLGLGLAAALGGTGPGPAGNSAGGGGGGGASTGGPSAANNATANGHAHGRPNGVKERPKPSQLQGANDTIQNGTADRSGQNSRGPGGDNDDDDDDDDDDDGDDDSDSNEQADGGRREVQVAKTTRPTKSGNTIAKTAGPPGLAAAASAGGGEKQKKGVGGGAGGGKAKANPAG
jgi:hypothetical protein